jgi:hypothetical protein
VLTVILVSYVSLLFYFVCFTVVLFHMFHFCCFISYVSLLFYFICFTFVVLFRMFLCCFTSYVSLLFYFVCFTVILLRKDIPPLPTSVQSISITKTLLIVPTKNERHHTLFTGKLLIKFQNILRNTTQVFFFFFFFLYFIF